MAYSRVTYAGDGVTSIFALTFPYISTSHISVELNARTLLSTEWKWVSESTLQLIRTDGSPNPPSAGDAIELIRTTSPSARIVDFTNGAVLTEADLDASALQMFYLNQEATDIFTDAIDGGLTRIATNNGITDVDDDGILGDVLAGILTEETAAAIQQAIADNETNASEIIVNLGIISQEILDRLGADATLQSQITALVNATVATAYVQPGEPVPGVDGIPDPIPEGSRWYDTDDGNHPYIWDDVGLVWLDLIDPRIGANAAAITALEASMTVAQGDIAGAESDIIANAAAIVVTDATVATLNGTVVSIASDVTTLQASLTTAQGDIIANASGISSLNTSVSTNASNITAVASDVTALTATVGTNTSNISGNATAVGLLDTRVTAAEGTILSQASSITVLNSTVNLRNRTFYQTAAPTASNAGDLWVDTDDNNKLYRWSGSAWVSIRDAVVTANATAVGLLDTRVSSAEGTITSHASSITSLNSSVSTNSGNIASAAVTIAAHTTAISTAEGDITTLEAKYGVTLNVGGYITGFAQNNDGSTGTFDILTDKFRIVDPASGGTSPRYVFGVESGNVYLQNLYLHQLVLTSTGYIRAGKTSVGDTTNGLWIGYDGSGSYDIHMGNASQSLWWDGSAGTLNINGTVQGTINFNSALVSLDDAGASVGYNTTAADTVSLATYETLRTFSMHGTGTITVRVGAYMLATPDISPGYIQLKKNGVTVGTATAVSSTSSTNEVVWTGITVSALTDVFTVVAKGGVYTGGDTNAHLRLYWTQLRCIVEHCDWS